MALRLGPVVACILLAIRSCAAGAHKVPIFLTTTLLPPAAPVPVEGAAWGIVGGYHGSVISQHLKLLALLTLGIQLRVDTIIIPHAASRIVKDSGRVEWQPEQPETLWDLLSIMALLNKHRIHVIKAETSTPPADAVQLPNYYFAAAEVSAIWADVHRARRTKVAAAVAAGQNLHNVTLVAPDLFLALRTQELALFTEVASEVQFAPKLRELADGVITRLRQPSVFNGLHLRMSGSLTQQKMQDQLERFFAKVQEFPTRGCPMYVASGIFSGRDVSPSLYKMLESWFRNWVVGRGYATKAVNLHIMLMNHTGAQSLHSEQFAAVDFMVLLGAERVVGSRFGPFSYFLQQLRTLRRLPQSSVVVVDGPWWLLPLTAGVQVKT